MNKEELPEDIDTIRKAMGIEKSSPLVTLMTENLTQEQRLDFARQVADNRATFNRCGFLTLGTGFFAVGAGLVLKDGLAAAWMSAASVISAGLCVQIYRDSRMISKKLHHTLGLE